MHLKKFPQVLLTEIFLRCLVESLVRAKCVCKHWYYLIKDPTFAVDHLQFQKSHDKGRLLVQYYNRDRYSYALFDDEALGSHLYHDIDHFHFNYGIHIEGPIDGLYCLFNCEDRNALWNPALKEFGTFPLPHPNFFYHFDLFTSRIGFGMDPLTHVYKLVLIRDFQNTIEYTDDYQDTYVTVYNLSTNTWRLTEYGELSIKNCSFYGTINSSYMDGIYYWWGAGTGVLIVFDMGKEIFREISGPDICYREFGATLTLYNAKVALFFRMNTGFDIWVMLEEGVWIKQFSFAFPPQLSEVGVWKKDVFLFCTNLSEPLDVDSSHIVLYSATTREMRDVGPRGGFQGFEASIFYESLVSITTSFELDNKTKYRSLNTILSDFFNVYLVRNQ